MMLKTLAEQDGNQGGVRNKTNRNESQGNIESYGHMMFNDTCIY